MVILLTECRPTIIAHYPNPKPEHFDYIIPVLVNNNLLARPSLSLLHNSNMDPQTNFTGSPGED